MTIRKKGEGHSKPSQKTTELSKDDKLSTSKKLLRFSQKVNNNSLLTAGIENYKKGNKKQSNKSCPFSCPNCQSLGQNLVRSKYEIVNILSDTNDSIYSPMHERYHEYDEDHRSIRNSSGKVFLSADLVIDSLFFQQQKFKK